MKLCQELAGWIRNCSCRDCSCQIKFTSHNILIILQTLRKCLDGFDSRWQEIDEKTKSTKEYKHMRGLYYLFSAMLKILLEKKSDFSQ